MTTATYVSVSNMSVINPFESGGATFIPINKVSVNTMTEWKKVDYCLVCGNNWEVVNSNVVHKPVGFFEKRNYVACPDCEMDVKKQVESLETQIVEFFERDILDIGIYQDLLRRTVTLKLAIHLGDQA